MIDAELVKAAEAAAAAGGVPPESVSAALVEVSARVATLKVSICDAMDSLNDLLKELKHDPYWLKKARNFKRYTRRYQRGKR